MATTSRAYGSYERRGKDRPASGGCHQSKRFFAVYRVPAFSQREVADVLQNGGGELWLTKLICGFHCYYIKMFTRF